MRISIINGGSDDNRGSSAVTLGMLKTFDKVFGNNVYSIHSNYNYKTDYSEYRRSVRNIRKDYPNLELYTSIFSGFNSKSKVKAMLSTLKAKILLLNPEVFSRLYSLRTIDAINNIANSDLVVAKGGYQFYSGKGLLSNIKLFKNAYLLLLAKKMGVKYAILGQSFGPFKSKYSLNLIKKLINGSEITTARDHESLAFLMTVEGINLDKISFEDDFAFSVTKPRTKPEALYENNLFLNTNKKFIGINLRELEYKNITREEYLNSFKLMVEYILKKTKYEVIIIPHSTGPSDFENDSIIAKDLYNLVKADRRVHLFKNTVNAPELLYLYNKLEVLIGTRIHSNISALSVGVPSVSISYEGYKSEILNDFGIENAIYKYEKLNKKTAIVIASRAISMIGDKELSSVIKEKLKEVRHETLQSFKNLKAKEQDDE